MKPAPKKIVWLMSVAGLGLSLGEAVHAKVASTSYAQFLADLGRLQEVERAGTGTQTEEDRVAGLVLRPFDATLATFEQKRPAPDAPAFIDARAALAPSQIDLDLTALAMVLMPDPGETVAANKLRPARESSVAKADAGVASTAASAFLVRQHEIAPTLHAYRGRLAGPEINRVVSPEQSEAITLETSRNAPGDGDSDEQRQAAGFSHTVSSTLDLDLHRYLGQSAAPGSRVPEAPQRSMVSADQDLSMAVDVLLPLAVAPEGGKARGAIASTTVDLNLDLGPGLDVNLDLPLALDLNLDPSLRLDWDRRFSALPTHTPTLELARSIPETAASRAGSLSCEAQPSSRRDSVVTEIVVTSHADRVLRSLEAMLTNSEASPERYGAQTLEVIVSSQAEKARLELADILRGRTKKDATVNTSSDADAPEATAGATATAQNVSASSQTSAPSRHDGSSRARSTIGDGSVVVSENKLDRVRGGFSQPGGLQVSFGIERAVYVNGGLVTTTSLNISGLGAGASTGALDIGSRGSSLIQIGSGNVLANTPLSAAALGTIVQNSLDGQRIQSVTTINATVNSVQLLRSQNLESSLRSAVIDSLRR